MEERKYVNGNEYFWNYWLNGTQILINGNGLLKMYYDSGDLKAEGNIKDSKKWGVWNEFSPKNSYVTVLNYTGWTGNYSTNISFRMELINSIDSNKIEIGKNGTGYRLSYRNDGTLKVKAHFVNNSLDSLFLFYKNGNPFEKKSAINLTQTINEAFYPNKVRAFQRVSSNERKYWDWFGNLNEEIVNTEVQGSDDSYKETTTFYYPNGTRREISECIITTTFDQSTGFMEAEYVCEKTEWDESGNKINEQ